jgi:SAM-dependent methyltransferase
LFAGEGGHEVGTRDWFVEHERVYLADVFVGKVPAMFSSDLRPDSRLLDAGCGPGFWVRHFLRLGIRQVTACDLTVTAVSLTRRSLDLFGLSAHVEVGNIEQLPYADGAFDHVNCQGVVHHTPDPHGALRELRRVLRPDGTLCFSVYHRNLLLRHPALLRSLLWAIAPFVSLKGRGRESLLAVADADEIVRRYDGRNNPLGRSYTIAELRLMVEPAFTIEEMQLFYFPARVLPFRIPRRLHAWLSRHAGLMVALRCRAR